ncbi:hydrogen peroxide-inducible genes activator [Xanthobacter sp. V4C-4]|uniref:hydrogen peroxide-inducible genes activator n=1 Tax=Xanthobacter cornucopiae TaxID=3119924 RepID=UPI003727C323
MLSLRQIRYFEALARHLHFGRAADECGVTQPALSMQIRDMEERLRARLVERTPSAVRLTPVGEGAAERARALLAAVSDFERTIRDHGQLLQGRLRLGVIASVGPYLLPRLLPEMARRHPKVEVSLRESLTDHLVTDLVQGDLDLAIVSLPLVHPALESRAVFDDPFVLAVPQSTAAAGFGGNVAHADQIRAEDLLLLEDGHCFRDQALNVCQRADARRLRRFGASSLSTLAQLVANGQGITLLPELFVRAEGAHLPRVRLIPFAAPAPSRTIGLAWRRTLPFPEDIEAMAEMIAACQPGADGGTLEDATE